MTPPLKSTPFVIRTIQLTVQSFVKDLAKPTPEKVN
jgi:hypothetical protein